MPRPAKGQKTPGSGIKKGDKHKRTMAEEACHRMGIDPFQLLAQKAIDGDVTCIIQLCKHIEPPKKPMEISMDPEKNVIKVEVFDYTKNNGR